MAVEVAGALEAVVEVVVEPFHRIEALAVAVEEVVVAEVASRPDSCLGKALVDP